MEIITHKKRNRMLLRISIYFPSFTAVKNVKCFAFHWDGGPRREQNDVDARYTLSPRDTNIVAGVTDERRLRHITS